MMSHLHSCSTATTTFACRFSIPSGKMSHVLSTTSDAGSLLFYPLVSKDLVLKCLLASRCQSGELVVCSFLHT